MKKRTKETLLFIVLMVIYVACSFYLKQWLFGIPQAMLMMLRAMAI